MFFRLDNIAVSLFLDIKFGTFRKTGIVSDRNLNKWRISAELLTNELTFHSLIFCMKNRSEEIVEVFHVNSHSFLATLATRFNNRKEGLF